MKKVLVLMLVLGFASMATAGLSLWVNGAPAESSTITLTTSEIVQIGLYNDGTVDQTVGYVSIASGPGSWSGGPTYALGAANTVTGSYAYYYGAMPLGDSWVFINSYPDVSVNGVGIIAEFEFHYGGGGDVVLTYTDDTTAVHDTLTIHPIPEPMTIGLLGLGGLFLRRRK